MPPRRASDTRRWIGVQALVWYAWAIDAVIVLPVAVLVYRTHGRLRAVRFLVGASVAGAVRQVFLRRLAASTSPGALTAGDPLSLARFTGSNVLAGLIAAGVRDRCSLAGRLAWAFALLGATVLDWLDGPLARRSGATRHGAALDIEADSWLTLWTAIAAATWGNLPRWVVLPPLVRYLHPLLDLCQGTLPHGGSPGWSRITGTAQMALLLAALAPIGWRPRPVPVTAATAVLSGSQLATTLIQLRRRMRG